VKVLKKYLPVLAVFIGSLLIIFRFYGNILANPSAFVFGIGDGIKNYYTVLYQTVHSESWHFKGMLHPYGDQLTFADGQPILTTLFKVFFEPSVASGQAMMGAMNLIMILSLVVCALLIHSILTKALVPGWFAVPFALIIAFLSPQIQRFSGHYALAYTFYIPLIWWMIIKLYQSDVKWGWAIMYFLVVVVFSLNQPYHLLLSLAFAGSLFAYNAFRVLVFKAEQSMWVWLLSISVLPAIALAAYFSFTEIYADRPLAPYGLGAYEASFSSVFVPIHGPMFTLVRDYLFRIWVAPEWEGQGYVGLPASLFLFLFLWKVASDIRRKKWKAPFWLSSPNVVRNALIPSVLVLLLSAGVLNRIGFVWISDHIVALKQFRSLGRLVWIFYYVFTVSAVVYFYMIYRYVRIASNGKLKIIAYSMIMMVFIVWGVDMVSNIKGIKGLMLSNKPTEFTFSKVFSNRLNSNGYCENGFQAILPIPFNLIGSEKIALQGSPESFVNAANASFSTGLPMFGGMMSRTSAWVTEKQAQMAANPFIEREILNDLESSDPILVVQTKGPLSSNEQFIITLCDTIFETEQFSVLALDPASLKLAVSNYRKSKLGTKRFEALSNCESVFFSSVRMIVEEGQSLVDTNIFGDSINRTCQVSYWAKMELETTGIPELFLNLEQNGELRMEHLISPMGSANLIDGWVRAEKQFELLEGINKISLVTKSKHGTLTQPVLTIGAIPDTMDSTFVWNNYPY
jgi:hypothetical protein